MAQTDILDLDVLIPSTCIIKIQGKELEAHPLSIKQLIRITNLRDELSKKRDPYKMYDTIIDVLSPMIPALKTDKTIDLNIGQLYAIINFAQKISMPAGIMPVTQEAVPKKKVDSQSP